MTLKFGTYLTCVFIAWYFTDLDSDSWWQSFVAPLGVFACLGYAFFDYCYGSDSDGGADGSDGGGSD